MGRPTFPRFADSNQAFNAERVRGRMPGADDQSILSARKSAFHVIPRGLLPAIQPGLASRLCQGLPRNRCQTSMDRGPQKAVSRVGILAGPSMLTGIRSSAARRMRRMRTMSPQFSWIGACAVKVEHRGRKRFGKSRRLRGEAAWVAGAIGDCWSLVS